MLVGQNINTGFSRVEYEDIYNIYYETVIVPLQNNIIDLFNEIDIPIKFNKFTVFTTSETFTTGKKPQCF